MKNLLPVLIVLAGLGSSFSLGQAVRDKDPFSRYKAGVKTRREETSLTNFATQCGVDVLHRQSKFAVTVGGGWSPVKDLAKGIYDTESDFFSTAQVWSQGKAVLVETWDISDTDGQETRTYSCYENGVSREVATISWSLPVVDDQGAIAWGFMRCWHRDSAGHMQRTTTHFVDEMERPIPKPKLDADEEKSLNWSPSLGPLNELKLPHSMLQ
jgi:hypothetical protein